MPEDQSQTLNQALVRASSVREAGIRFLDRRERATWLGWSEVHDKAQRVAAALVSRGVEPGASVGLIFPTCPDFFSAFFGVLLAGAVPAPLYPPMRLGRLDRYQIRTAKMLAAARIQAALVDEAVSSLVEEALHISGCRGFRLSDLPQNDSVFETVDADDLALIQFSSGTTVDPKPVALSHRAVMAQAVTLNSFWPDNASVRHTGVSWLPLYHDMGLIGCVFPALERPSELTLIPPDVFVARPAQWLRAISQYHATVSPAPNFAYGLCLERVRDRELDGVDLSCWRVALNGAEPIAPTIAREFCRRFSRWGFRAEAMTPVYGLSEAALAVTFSSTEEIFETKKVAREQLRSDGEVVLDNDGMELISVGEPLPGFEIDIRSLDGEPLPEGRVGVIWVKGPSLMKGYLHQPEATSAVMPNDWLDTGDLGFVLEGKLFVTGRAKDILIVRGQNHTPEEIESIVSAVPGVRAGGCAAVSFMPEGEPTERVVVFVERQTKSKNNRAEEIATTSANQVLALTGIKLDKIEVLNPGTLPRTSSGKIRRSAALHRFLAGELNGCPQPTL